MTRFVCFWCFKTLKLTLVLTEGIWICKNKLKRPKDYNYKDLIKLNYKMFWLEIPMNYISDYFTLPEAIILQSSKTKTLNFS